eukprot:GHVQ01003256.1.p1 GENE.GHVQ01003256.1~~GHVQ01003256.1.p1  ORF type:complete len:124 (-),score=21.79 GHVQ01003256.1:178-549(-)
MYGWCVLVCDVKPVYVCVSTSVCLSIVVPVYSGTCLWWYLYPCVEFVRLLLAQWMWREEEGQDPLSTLTMRGGVLCRRVSLGELLSSHGLYNMGMLCRCFTLHTCSCTYTASSPPPPPPHSPT